jgi:hypothetical protein
MVLDNQGLFGCFIDFHSGLAWQLRLRHFVLTVCVGTSIHRVGRCVHQSDRRDNSQ